MMSITLGAIFASTEIGRSRAIAGAKAKIGAGAVAGIEGAGEGGGG